MENKQTVSFNFFEQELVDRVIHFVNLDESLKTNENKEVLKQEIKIEYKKNDENLKELIANGLVTLKEEHKNNIKSLEEELVSKLAATNEQYADRLDSKEYKDVKFGLEIACKRAKIKEKNRYNEEIAELQNLISKGEDEAK